MSSAEDAPARARRLGAITAGLGVAVVVVTNRLRLRPAFFHPWWHVVAALAGGTAGARLGGVYADVDREAAYQQAGYRTLPTWAAEAGASAADVDAAAARGALASARDKWLALTAADEAAYKAAKQAAKPLA